MLIIAGQGNPGEKYAGNRHNIGFMALDKSLPPIMALARGKQNSAGRPLRAGLKGTVRALKRC